MLIDSSEAKDFIKKQQLKRKKIKDIGIDFLNKISLLEFENIKQVDVCFMSQNDALNLTITAFIQDSNWAHYIYNWQDIPEIERDIKAVYELLKKEDFSLFGKYELLGKK